jgi:hypothetical protein
MKKNTHTHNLRTELIYYCNGKRTNTTRSGREVL